MKLHEIKIRNKYFFLIARARVTLFGNTIISSNKEMEKDFHLIYRSILNEEIIFPEKIHWTRIKLFLHELLHLKQKQRVGTLKFIQNTITDKIHNASFHIELNKLLEKSPKQLKKWFDED